MEMSENINTEPIKKPHTDYAAEAIRLVDEGMAQETTLLEGLAWGVERGWFSTEEAEQCFQAYIDARNSTEANH